MTKKKPILLIDDLLSELDEDHKLMLVNKIKYYQTFITSIELKTKEDNLIRL
jgi:recombinational DNA repair ATPase RecF